MSRKVIATLVPILVVVLAHLAGADAGADVERGASACRSAINTSPEACAKGVWLQQSAIATANGSGNFWPPECGPPGPAPDYVIPVENICGCIEGPLDYYPAVDHFGCRPGPNGVSRVFEKYPWCYMQNGLACPAAFSAGPGKPAMRQCGGTIKQTGQGNAFGDQCAGTGCGYPSFGGFLTAWAKPEVLATFKRTGVLPKIVAAGPIGGCDGPKCKNFTLVLPLFAGQDSPEPLPKGLDLDRLVLEATGYGVAYAGEVYDGRSWYTLGNSVTVARLPTCPNVAAAAFWDHGFPSDAGGTSNVPPTPCISLAPCVSEIVLGDGILFNGARVSYWFITNEAIVYFTEAAGGERRAG